jgi:LAO/AO transport system kinase
MNQILTDMTGAAPEARRELPALTLKSLQEGGKRAMAGALAAAENTGGSASEAEAVAALLDDAWLAPRARTLGLTGPPGVGKSTLIDGLIRRWRRSGASVGVIAVDPSSHLTGGALLGDRIRMRTNPGDEGVFIRSLASRGRLGGLSDLTFAASVLMRAVYDRVIIESVGVGQSEADIASVADTVALCVQPGSGDALQFMKAGIMEIPHVAAVTKADMGAAATRALGDLKSAMGLFARKPGGWEVPCLSLSASTGEGVDAFIDACERHYVWLDEHGLLAPQRHGQAQTWLRSHVWTHFGLTGVEAAGEALTLTPGTGPFAKARALGGRFLVTFAEE